MEDFIRKAELSLEQAEVLRGLAEDFDLILTGKNNDAVIAEP